MEDLARLLDEYERSGLTTRQHVSQLGMGYSTLTKWLRRARQQSTTDSSQPKAEFVPVQSPLPFGGPLDSANYFSPVMTIKNHQ